MRQGTGGVESLHQELERHVLIFVGRQAAPADPGQHVGNAGIAGQVDPQHQRVDEEAHQFVQGGIAPPGDRKAHGHIGSRGDLAEQHRQGGLHHHETGGVVRPRHGADVLLQLGRPVDVHVGAAVVGHRRVRSIRRQLDPFGQARQRALPIRELLDDRALRVVEVSESGALPEGVIHVLHRERRPLWGPSGAAAGIGDPQVVHQRIQRPTIRSNMMDHRHQHMLVVGGTEKLGLQGYFG
ncbi:hypothetical protein MINTM007_31580 [Mycobacterium intracellulare]|nr:hypothetical protein MINTM007_31580 [Mycobacterium intracellulare]